MSHPFISIVIVSYHAKGYVDKCLQSLFAAPFNGEIIIVDNNSADGTISMVKEKFPVVKIIENKFNAGFSRANNRGIEMASGKYVFLLNPDTEVLPGALAQMLAFLEENPGYGILAPKLLNSDRSIQHSLFRFTSVWDIIAEIFYLHLLYFKTRNYRDKEITAPMEIEAASGAALFIRKAVFDKTGLLDENLFWSEDIDFCYRAKKQEVRVVYFPGSEIIHHGGQSSGSNSKMVISNQVISKLKFFNKHASYPVYFCANLFTFIFILSRIIFLPLAGIFSRQMMSKAAAYLYTLKKYLRYNFRGDNSIL